MNGHIGLIHSILPATVDLHVKIPESHPSASNLGSERVGSGTIVDPDGYILTVHYVTVGASSITVTLPDGEQYPAQVAAQDQETGLSLVKIAAHDLPHLKLAPADSVALGQPVVMIASSGRSGRRVSGGYVSSARMLRRPMGIHDRQNHPGHRVQSRLWRRHAGQFSRRIGSASYR